MTVQRSVSCLFLVLLSLSVVQFTVERAAAHVSIREQWRAVHECHAVGRLSQRPTLEPPVVWSATLIQSGTVLALDTPGALVPIPRAVFVPPRV